jgi:hypothetical protein
MALRGRDDCVLSTVATPAEMTRFLAAHAEPLAWLLYLATLFAIGMALQCLAVHMLTPSAPLF